MRKSLLIIAALFVFVPLGKAQCTGGASPAWTWTLSNNSTVGANNFQGCINQLVDGDAVTISAGTATWTTGVNASGKGISIIGSGQCGTPIASCSTGTIITDHLSSGNMIVMTPTFGNSTSRISSMTILPFLPRSGYSSPFFVSGTCSAGGCPNFRMDHVTLPNTWSGIGISDDTFLIINDVFGVADHNTAGDGVGGGGNGVSLTNIQHASWKGVGKWGDNSWASADTLGTNQAFFLENNIFTGLAFGVDTDNPSPDGTTTGGGRFVCRFNTFNNISQSGACAMHGTDTGGRMRSGRQGENYFNTGTCTNSAGCSNTWGGRGGVVFAFGNTWSNAGSGFLTNYANLDAQRRWRVDNPWGPCDGSGLFDRNDGIIYWPASGSGTSTITSLTTTGTGYIPGDSTGTWTTNQWAPASPAGTNFSFHDVTQLFGFEIASNTVNTFSSAVSCIGNGCSNAPVIGDSYQILRATACMDQPGRGAGLLVQDQPATISTFSESGSTVTINVVGTLPTGFLNGVEVQVLASNNSYNGGGFRIFNVTSNSFQYTLGTTGLPSGSGGTTTAFILANTGLPGSVQQPIDPWYEFIDSGPGTLQHAINSADRNIIANRDFYQETIPTQAAQTSPTSPFNGTSGNGHGTLANRPATCTAGVGYWATNEGNWNTTLPANTSGDFYICGAGGWPASPSYTPFTYPHPLVSLSPIVSFSPTSVSFPNTAVGASATPINVSLTNTGAATLTISSMSLSGGSPFSFSTSPASNCGGSVAPGASCTITFNFLPTSVQLYSATFTMTDNASGSPHTIAITGTGTGAVIFLNPNSLNFGSQFIGTTSSFQTVTLKNTGNLTMNIVSILSGDPVTFPIQNAGAGSCVAASNTLAPNASCTFQVAFHPSVQGAISNSVSVTSNAVNSPSSVSLIGIGVASLATTGCLLNGGVFLNGGVQCQ